MKFHRIYGMLLRNMYNLRRSMDRWVDVTIFPVIDLLLFGMSIRYFANLAASQISPSIYALAIVLALIFWTIVLRISSDMPIVVLDDIWSKNLINIFASPLTVGEWLVSSGLIGVVKALIASAFTAALAVPLFHTNIFGISYKIVPFVFLLLLSGLWLGFCVSALIVRFGTRVQAFAWTVPALLSPFSGIYYPISILPAWARAVSDILPTTYMFAALRKVILENRLDWHLITISLLLNIVYVVFSLFFVNQAFKRRMRVGMLKMH